jgi:hypothetical protein
MLAEGDVADDLRRDVHIAGLRNDGRFALIGTDHREWACFILRGWKAA